VRVRPIALVSGKAAKPNANPYLLLKRLRARVPIAELIAPHLLRRQ